PPRACASYLAALPSTRAIPNRDVSYVADPISSIEIRLLPTLTRSCPCHFTFYVARPTRSIETRSLPTLTRSCPRQFTFYVARPPRSIRSEGFLRFCVRTHDRAPPGALKRSKPSAAPIMHHKPVTINSQAIPLPLQRVTRSRAQGAAKLKATSAS